MCVEIKTTCRSLSLHHAVPRIVAGGRAWQLSHLGCPQFFISTELIQGAVIMKTVPDCVLAVLLPEPVSTSEFSL